MNREVIICSHCKEEVEYKTKICPNCGHTIKKYEAEDKNDEYTIEEQEDKKKLNKIKIKDIIGFLFLLAGIFSISDIKSFFDFIRSLLIILFGLSLLSYTYEFLSKKIKIKYLNIIIPIVIIILIGILNGISQNKNINIEEYSKNSLEEIKEKLTDYKWPNNELGNSLPQPDSKIGVELWETSDGFVIYVGQMDKNKYDEYVEKCSKAGFNINYRRGSDYYYADNKDGYSLSLKYEGDDILFIRMDKK